MRKLISKQYPKQGKFLGKWMIETGNNTITLAEKIGGTPTQISFYMNGKTTPSLKTAVNLANVMGCSLDELAKAFL